jgi:tRNA (Thr-GGU) A37 N-methylase
MYKNLYSGLDTIKEVPIDDIKCFVQFSHLKEFTVSHLNDEDFTSFLAHQN